MGEISTGAFDKFVWSAIRRFQVVEKGINHEKINKWNANEHSGSGRINRVSQQPMLMNDISD